MEIPSTENLKKIRNNSTSVIHTKILTHAMEEGEKSDGSALVSAPHIKPAIPPIMLANPIVTIRTAMGLSPIRGLSMVLSINNPTKKRLTTARHRAAMKGMPVKAIIEKQT